MHKLENTLFPHICQKEKKKRKKSTHCKSISNFKSHFQVTRNNHFQSQAIKQIKIHHTCETTQRPKGQIIRNIHVSKQNVIMPPQFFDSKRGKSIKLYIKAIECRRWEKKKKNPLLCHLSQAVNGTSRNPINRINLQNSPKVFCPKLVLLHAFI